MKPVKAPDCPACEVPMKHGHLENTGFYFPSHWRETDAKGKATARQLAVLAFRCPGCGVIQLHSPPKKWNKVD